MDRRRWLLAVTAGFGAQMTRARAARGQVIEFESGGLKYQTQSKNGVTVMFAAMPLMVREYAVLQVAVSNGSEMTWLFKPEDFVYHRPDGTKVQAATARAVVTGFIERGGRDDVVKLVSAYEQGLYGMSSIKSTNGYESRRQAAMSETSSARLKAAAAASAIVFTPVRLKPGESTDGAVFYPNGGKPLGSGKLIAAVAGGMFEFNSPAPQVLKSR